MATVQDVVTKVASQTTVVSGVETMVEGVVVELRRLRDEIAAGGNAELLDQLINDLSSNDTRLGEATARGTAAASEVS